MSVPVGDPPRSVPVHQAQVHIRRLAELVARLEEPVLLVTGRQRGEHPDRVARIELTIQVLTGIEFTGQVKGSWTLWLAGLFSVAFGVLIAVNPGSGVLAILWLIGFYAILGGVLRLVFAYRMRNDRTHIKSAVRNLGAAASR